VKPDSNDLLAAIGLSALGYGLWQVYPPSAYIADGAIVLVIAILRARG